MQINEDLKRYIEENIFPEYALNDDGHKLDHIDYVIKRSLNFAKQVPNINYDMVYTIASYHDIAHHIDKKNHEKLSGDYLLKDENLKRFFTNDQIKIMYEAICDHRASSKIEPRNIYGKIVSSADRNTDVTSILKRTYDYRINDGIERTQEELIEESRQHIIDKFGPNGYAIDKMYFEDKEYEQYLKDVRALTNDKEHFVKEYKKVNNLK